jgi:transcription elongation factor Elf1
MAKELLVNTVNSALGQGKPTSKGNYSYACPFCNSTKRKLEINLDKKSPYFQNWHCWVCDSKGKKLINLFKKINVSPNILHQIKKYAGGNISKTDSDLPPKIAELPKEFIPLSESNPNNIEVKNVVNYLKKRGFTKYDILKYNIGYCDEGQFSKHIIIPSYDKDNKLNYFTAREYYGKSYSNPPISRDTIIFESQINWNIPIILCEGVFDAITIKRNAIPLLGKSISKELLKKIVTSQVQKIYIALDKDAIKQSLKHCEYLINQGKQVYLVEMDQKDANEIGFRDITQIIQNTYQLTEYDLMDKKLNLV